MSGPGGWRGRLRGWWPVGASGAAAQGVTVERVAQLQRAAHFDAASGLPRRSPFLAALGQRLALPGGPGLVLLLVRLRCGWEWSDATGSAVADLLQTYVDRVPGAHAARLAIDEFALVLPVAGVAGETAHSLHATLSSSPVLRQAGAVATVGGVEGLVNHDTADALALANAALAEAARGGSPVVLGHADLESLRDGAWRVPFQTALDEGRARLAMHRVVDAAGRTLHWDCPLRVQLEPEGGFHAASHWLALARRSRLLPRVDLCAITLALRAIEADGEARAVHAAPASLATPGFIPQVSAALAGTSRAARRLAIEIADAPGEPPLATPALAEAAAAWRHFGVRLGLEHDSAPAQALPTLRSRGMAYVKLGPRHWRGLSNEGPMRAYVQALLGLVQGLGVAAYAEGVDDVDDLARLWELGFDGATGPAVRD